MSTLLITGRIPDLSIAELESLYGGSSITRLGDHALVDSDVDFARLGGSIKSAEYIATVDSTNAQKVFDFCRKAIPDYLEQVPEGKIKLGVSLYGLTMPVQRLNANVLSLKKVIKQTGRSVRAVPNTDPALSSAQTYHNALTSDVGIELACIAHDGKTYIGRVTHVQDIDSYTIRDRNRPKRDAFVGMLPPKLAQTMINIASGPVKRSNSSIETSSAASVASEDSDVEKMSSKSQVVLDPFCGTGVILQEAALMGYSVYGTDVSEKMVHFTRDNFNWATEKFKISVERQFEIADAISHTWRQPIDAVAGEGYLGQPLGGQVPSPEKLKQIMHDSQVVMRGFLKNIAPQLVSGTRLCVAIPAWHVAGKLHELDLASEIETLGYHWTPFTHVDGTRLMYSRDDQTTHRHLLAIEKS
ncbi:MAG: DNA methyltransferase [Candidatus Saccharimonadales bacterium]